jgi:anti-sigma regulatory factor (Ser/Thr protein kinase)
LFRANNSLIPEIPPAMFVTCLFGILSTETGEFTYANAGHNLPYVRTASGVTELRARGMPLGLLPDMNYEVMRARVELGETMLLTSDGIVEAHSAEGDMFGFDRLQKLVGGHEGGPDLISAILDDLHRFQGFDREQEDDVTMVTVRRLSSALESATAFGEEPGPIASFSYPSASGNERLAMEAVAEVATGLGLTGDRLERLKTAVSEAAMNAIEHGNKGDPGLAVEIEVLANAEKLIVRIRDQGGGSPIAPPVTPDLEAKLAGEQSPRGWGLFLIERMVDAMRTSVDGDHHIIELEMARGGN